jgi:hypothetical protein
MDSLIKINKIFINKHDGIRCDINKDGFIGMSRLVMV